jgi:hypothetical protein
LLDESVRHKDVLKSTTSNDILQSLAENIVFVARERPRSQGFDFSSQTAAIFTLDLAWVDVMEQLLHLDWQALHLLKAQVQPYFVFTSECSVLFLGLASKDGVHFIEVHERRWGALADAESCLDQGLDLFWALQAE